MAKLKLGAFADDKPVKRTVEFPALVHREYLDLMLPFSELRAMSSPACACSKTALQTASTRNPPGIFADRKRSGLKSALK